MTIKKRLIGIFFGLIALYGAGVTLYTLLQLTIGEQFVVIAWLNNLAYLLWSGAIILIIPCILFRRYKVILLLITPTLVFSINYLPMYFERSVDTPPVYQELSVLTYNINLAPPDLHGIAQDIREIDADIVAIQELTPNAGDVFEAELASQYPYRAFHPVRGFYGQGVMSKYPITDDTFWKIYLGHQRVEIDINGEPIVLYNVHPVHHILPFWGFDVSRRTEEVDAFLDKASVETLPVLIVGDMNMTDQSRDYQNITAHYHDSYKQVGYGMGTTFPAHLPIPSLLRIDYVFHSDVFTPLTADVLYSSGGSDHRPLVVTLALGQ